MERQSLLDAIRQNPSEDICRLQYADWLDEYGQGDVDKASVEFIRVSCPMKEVKEGKRPPNVMPREAYKWIGDNWKRLVPETLKLHKKWLGSYSVITEPIYCTKGRNIWMRIGLEGKRYRANETKVYGCSCELEFFRGFVQEFRTFSHFTDKIIRPVLELEQPLLNLAAGIRAKRNAEYLVRMETNRKDYLARLAEHARMFPNQVAREDAVEDDD